MVNAPQLGRPSTNQTALENFRHNPFAAAADVLKARVVDQEKAASNLSDAEERRRQREEAKMHMRNEAEERRKEALNNIEPAPRVTPPTPEGLRLVNSFIVRKNSKPRITEFPKDVLERGLKLDREAEEQRCAAERAQAEANADYKERLRVGYIMDVQSTALSHLRREDINLEAKVLLLEEMGCPYSANAKNGRDAVYFHEKSGAEILVRGGAIDDSSRNEAKNPTSSLERAKRQAKILSNRAERLAAQPRKGTGGQKVQPDSGKKKKGAK